MLLIEQPNEYPYCCYYFTLDVNILQAGSRSNRQIDPVNIHAVFFYKKKVKFCTRLLCAHPMFCFVFFALF